MSLAGRSTARSPKAMLAMSATALISRIDEALPWWSSRKPGFGGGDPSDMSILLSHERVKTADRIGPLELRRNFSGELGSGGFEPSRTSASGTSTPRWRVLRRRHCQLHYTSSKVDITSSAWILGVWRSQPVPKVISEVAVQVFEPVSGETDEWGYNSGNTYRPGAPLHTDVRGRTCVRRSRCPSGTWCRMALSPWATCVGGTCLSAALFSSYVAARIMWTTLRDATRPRWRGRGVRGVDAKGARMVRRDDPLLPGGGRALLRWTDERVRSRPRLPSQCRVRACDGDLLDVRLRKGAAHTAAGGLAALTSPGPADPALARTRTVAERRLGAPLWGQVIRSLVRVSRIARNRAPRRGLVTHPPRPGRHQMKKTALIVHFA